MNKIMIDGIDVSDTTDRLTKDIERLSEENEKLKSQITSQDCEIYDLKSKNEIYKQEIEELKTQLKQVKYLYEVQDEKLIDELATENRKYKQALEDIKGKCKEYNFSTDIYDESDILAGEIFQIIEGKAKGQ